MLYLVVGGFLVLATLVGLCFAASARNQYLLVLSGSKYGPIFLERQEGGRYALISRAEVVLALLRFAAFSIALAAVSAWCQTRDRVQALVPSVSRMNA
jgi:hypothetical protein